MKLLKPYIFLLLLLLAKFNLFAQQSDAGFFLRGFVLANDTTTIPLANIENTSNRKRYITNRFGAFGLLVNIDDTLVFSVIGYQNYVLAVRSYVERNFTDPIKVKMKPITYRLKEVDITYNKRFRDSLAARAAVFIKNSPLQNNYDHIFSYYSGSTGGALSSLLAGSNKKVQEYEKLIRLIALYREQEKVDARYNLKLIMRATGLNETDAIALKAWCNLPNYFVLNSNDYDIIMAIKNCYHEFKNQR
jgi:hypothetical protein